MKKIFLLFFMWLIFHLSSTSHLQVIDPSTWFNQTEYQEDLSLSFLWDTGSEFYHRYDDVTSTNFILHKLSHILFYAILSVLFYINVKKRLSVSLACLFLFALSDEIHQYFVIGRSGRLLDVLLDFLAGAICLTVIHLWNKQKNRSET